MYFGTDGIRGAANGRVLRPDVVVRIAQAVGHVMRGKLGAAYAPTVVIGKDTRLSGYMLESALQAGFTSVGFTCLLVGPLPTPAVAMLSRSLRADLGVMVTASHNPYEDNGIKIFTPDGAKLGSDVVAEVERLIDAPSEIALAGSEKIGRATRLDDAVGRYMEWVKSTAPADLQLHGMRLVVDGANGAAYKIAPKVFWEMGAEVIRLGSEPNGFNINRGVGALAPDLMCKTVVQQHADMGIAVDGDADRLMLCDETGALIDGDQVLAAMATYLRAEGKLKGNAVVGTVMANMGLEKYLQSIGLTLIRTAVGDHNVEQGMLTHGCNLGGEPNGHLIFGDYADSGDGILAAVQVLAYLRAKGLKASAMRGLYKAWPQVTENVRLPEGADAGMVLANGTVKDAVAGAEKALGGNGRILVRKSGTEPLIRVMVEAADEALMRAQVGAVSSAVSACCG